MNHEISFEIVF